MIPLGCWNFEKAEPFHCNSLCGSVKNLLYTFEGSPWPENRLEGLERRMKMLLHIMSFNLSL